jgi:hypothetical protein
VAHTRRGAKLCARAAAASVVIDVAFAGDKVSGEFMRNKTNARYESFKRMLRRMPWNRRASFANKLREMTVIGGQILRGKAAALEKIAAQKK